MLEQKAPDMDKLPGGWMPETGIFLDTPSKIKIDFPLKNIITIDGFLSNDDCTSLGRLLMEAPNLESVGINGFMDNTDESKIGSKRSTMWIPQVAEEIWSKLKHIQILENRKMNSLSSTDWWQGDKNRIEWEPYGVSPMMRFMMYNENGEHYAHYDAGFIYPDDNYRTLMSYVIYLTDCSNGGQTRFIKDNQENIPIWERNHNDWERRVNDDEVLASVKPVKGRILLFDHRECHDVEEYLGDTPRVIIRGDIIFKAK